MNATGNALRIAEVTVLASLRGLFIATAFGFGMSVLLLSWCSGALGHLLEALQRHPHG